MATADSHPELEIRHKRDPTMKSLNHHRDFKMNQALQLPNPPLEEVNLSPDLMFHLKCFNATYGAAKVDEDFDARR